MGAAFNKIRLKIDRASHTKKTMDAEVAAFLATQPHEVKSEFNTEERKRIYRARKLAVPPVSIGLLAGEVIGHLRSVLDHTVWAIAAQTVAKPREAAEFPIFADREKYRGGRWKIGDLPADAKKIIDECQPYNSERPTFEPLWVLHRLANIDKHRIITVLLAAPQWIEVIDPNLFKPGMLSGGANIGPFEDDAVIAWISGPNLQADMEVDAKFTFHLILDFERRPLAVGPTIDWFYEAVSGVIRRLAPFLRDAP